MPSPLKLSLIILSLLFSGAVGYWYGGQNAKTAYGEHFISDSLTREHHEARHDLGILRLLSEYKTEEALQMAQHRYYGRLVFAADIATQSPNPNLRQILQAQLVEAEEFRKSRPYEFPTKQDQGKWAALIKSLQ